MPGCCPSPEALKGGRLLIGIRNQPTGFLRLVTRILADTYPRRGHPPGVRFLQVGTDPRPGEACPQQGSCPHSLLPGPVAPSLPAALSETPTQRLTAHLSGAAHTGAGGSEFPPEGSGLVGIRLRKEVCFPPPGSILPLPSAAALGLA